MSHLLGWWAQIWPNLVASVIWATPVFVWHHRRLKKHIDRRVGLLHPKIKADLPTGHKMSTDGYAWNDPDKWNPELVEPWCHCWMCEQMREKYGNHH